MEDKIIKNIPVKVDFKKMTGILHINSSEDKTKVKNLILEAEKLARPKGLYKEVFIQKVKDNQVFIDDIVFEGSLIATNLRNIDRIFPFLITAGKELEKWAKEVDGLLEKYWAIKIQESILQQATNYIFDKMEERFNLDKMATMNPGSLEDWPISEQRKLFDLIGDTEDKVGVKLTDSYLMLPSKSLSGIRFATDLDYVNCKICSRVNCPDRRAKYDEMFYQENYQKK